MAQWWAVVFILWKYKTICRAIISKCYLQLGTYEPSSPSTKELYKLTEWKTDRAAAENREKARSYLSWTFVFHWKLSSFLGWGLLLDSTRKISMDRTQRIETETAVYSDRHYPPPISDVFVNNEYFFRIIQLIQLWHLLMINQLQTNPLSYNWGTPNLLLY